MLTHQPGRYLTKNELVKYRIIITQPPVFDKQKNTTGGLFMQKNGENQPLSSEIIADLEEKLMARNVIIAILATVLVVTFRRK